MPTHDSAVTVTATEARIQPAFAKLARACIALARLQVAARRQTAAETARPEAAR